MTEKLREHIEGLFAGAPKTRQMVEFKEEILQNTIDRYNDLLSDGKTEQAAYNIAIAGIGDVQSIIDSKENNGFDGYTREEIEKNRRSRALMLTVAVMMYILSVAPIIALSVVGLEELGVVLMFVMIAAATGLIIYRASTKLPVPQGDETVIEEFKEWRRKKNDSRIADTICNVIWVVFTVFYLGLSFLTEMWAITWLIFPIIIAVCNIVHAIADICRK